MSKKTKKHNNPVNLTEAEKLIRSYYSSKYKIYDKKKLRTKIKHRSKRRPRSRISIQKGTKIYIKGLHNLNHNYKKKSVYKIITK